MCVACLVLGPHILASVDGMASRGGLGKLKGCANYAAVHRVDLRPFGPWWHSASGAASSGAGRRVGMAMTMAGWLEGSALRLSMQPAQLAAQAEQN